MADREYVTNNGWHVCTQTKHQPGGREKPATNDSESPQKARETSIDLIESD
jgi:hypothetical protein